MKILVINVSLRPNSREKLFPIGLGYITTAIKNAGFGFDLLDIDCYRYSYQYIENFIKNNRYDVVCMGCIVTGYKIIKSLSSLIKENHPETKIIAGNSVATSIVNTLLTRTKVDIAVMGEGDETIVELLDTISKGKPFDNIKGISFLKDRKVISTPARPLIKDISNLAFINYSIFDIESYIQSSKVSASEPLMIPRDEVRALPVNTARGCIANCSFCYHVFRGLPYRYRSADSIVREIRFLIERYALNYIFFWDELTFFSKKQTLEFVQRIIDEDLNFYWTACCRADLFNDDEDIFILKKIKEAGCVGMSYSLESADAEILKAMHKHTTVEQFSKQTELFHRAGLTVWTSLVMGYPQETPETLKKTFDCCIKNRIYPSTGYLLPQPGSEMYDYAVKNGFIKDEEDFLMKMGDRQDLRLNMTSMNDDKFQGYVIEGLKECNKILKLGLEEDRLIKTLYYRAKK
jgi:radical SAM superfamily enzyme YgiQ (UPF0313 family)